MKTADYIEIKNLVKQYPNVTAVNDISLDLPDRGMVFILGKSGCGKTTLLNIIGGLDDPTSGSVVINGEDTGSFDEKSWDNFRNCRIGFIFQDYNLIDDLTVSQNIELVLNIQNEISAAEEKKALIEKTLAFVGLDGFGDRKVSKMSGGQRQRVAVARAVIKKSSVILADEPTGNLDQENGRQIFDLLRKISASRLVIVVTHDAASAMEYGDRVIRISDGKIIEDTELKGKGAKTVYNIRVTGADGQVRLELSNLSLEAAKESVAEFVIGAPGTSTYTFSIDEVKSEPEAYTERSDGAEVSPKPLPWRTKLVMAQANLGKKRLRLFITLLMFALTVFLLMIVSFILTYDRTEVISKYLTDQGMNEVLLYQNKDYVNVFGDKRRGTIRMGEKYADGLRAVFPTLRFKERLTVTITAEGEKFPHYANDVAMMLTDDPDTVGRKLKQGRFPENGSEVVLTDYIAEIMLKDKDMIGKTVNVQNIDCTVVGIIGTDYADTDIALRANYGLLNAAEMYELDNVYAFALASEDFIDTMKEASTAVDIYMSDFFESEHETSYLDSKMTFAPLPGRDAFDGEMLIAGRLPENDNEVLIPGSMALMHGIDAASFEGPYHYDFPDIYDEHFNDAFIDKLNMNSLFPQGIDVVGIYSTENFDGYMMSVLLPEAQFDRLNGYYLSNYYCTDTVTFIGDMDVREFVKTADSNDYMFNEPLIAKIYTFYGFIETYIKIIVIIFVVVLIITMFMLSLFISNNIRINEKKVGVLKAIGVKTGDVVSIFLSESVMMSIISFLLAVAASVVFIFYVNTSVADQIAGHEIEYLYWNVGAAGAVLIFSVLMSVLSAVLPLLKLSQKKPIEIIRDQTE